MIEPKPVFDWCVEYQIMDFSSTALGTRFIITYGTSQSLTCHSFLSSLQKFVQGLSILSRGTLEEKLCWTFQLYDINSDGHITKEEMSDIVTAIYNLMAHPEEKIDDDRIKAKVDRIFDVSREMSVWGIVQVLFTTQWVDDIVCQRSPVSVKLNQMETN